MADPVGYLRALVSKETVTSEGLVDYRTLPYSHLVGIETPAAIRERWRRVVWTIMQHNVACKQWDERWYLNVWTVHALAGGRPLALAQYLHEQDPMISAHHLTLELHPNVNRKAITIADELTIGEDPPPEDLWEALRWIEPE